MTSYKHILCATDFSPRCKVAAERASALAKLLEAKLTVLHVVDHFPVDRSNQLIAPEDFDPAAYREAAARSSMAALVSDLACTDAGQEIRFCAGAARYEIIRFIEEQQVDLAVVASRAHHGIAGLLGSTANALVNRAACDVLVVRPEEEQA